MSEDRLQIERFNEALDAVRRTYPALHFGIETQEADHVSATIPQQEGLDFDVGVSLSNNDELCLSVEGLYAGWFPCSEQRVLDAFVDALLGVIAGRYRVRVVYRYGSPVKAQLKCPDGDGWRVIATTRIWFRGLLPFGRTERVIWNTAAPPPAEPHAHREDLHRRPIVWIWFLPLRSEPEPQADT